MIAPDRFVAPFVASVALIITAGAANAAPAEVVESSSTFGSLSLPYTTGFSQSVAPLAGYSSSDFFLADYGFSIGSNGSFSSALVTFDLGSILQLSDVTLTLLTGTPWSGPVPSALSSSQISDRNARAVETSWGTTTTQTLNPMTLGVGDYTVEVRGRVTGSFGGSYGGVLNVASVSAVPEPAGIVLAFAGLALISTASRRRNR